MTPPGDPPTDASPHAPPVKGSARITPRGAAPSTGLALAGLLFAGLSGVAIAAAAVGPEAPALPIEAPLPTSAAPSPERPVAKPLAPETLDALLARARFDPKTQRYVAEGGGRASHELTLVPDLQRRLAKLLSSYQLPLGELVAIDPRSGRILALARSAAPGDGTRDLAQAQAFPAASVFKLVTVSALLGRGLAPTEEVCYHGGKHRLHARELADDDRRDRRCVTLAQAVAHSTNVAVAKLADRNLDPVLLRDWARKLLFDRPLPLDFATAPSTALVPADRFDFARTAAGFGEVLLNPLHAAALAAAIGHDGLLAKLTIVEGAGASPEPMERLLPASLAHELTSMMELTVREGTARKAFRGRAARALAAAGKTGSLATHAPFRDYSWFVGFAPARDPRIAVAALVVNGARWRVHASTLAEAAMQAYLEPHALPKAPAVALATRR